MTNAGKKTAIIVIDIMSDFITGPLKFDRGQDIIESASRLVNGARSKGVPIIFACDAHYKDIDREFELWGEHAVRGTSGAAPIKELNYNPDTDYMIYKRRYSAFFKTDLDMLLSELGVETVVLCGIHTHICVQHTAADAYFNGFNIVLAEDATTAFTQQDHDQAVKFMHDMYGVTIKDTKTILEEI